MTQNTETAIIQPFFKDIKYASQRLGISIYAVRVLIWNRLVRPVRKGSAYLFTEPQLLELAGKLASGEFTFPKVPTRKKDITRKAKVAA
jgi:hypothetical protein